MASRGETDSTDRCSHIILVRRYLKSPSQTFLCREGNWDKWHRSYEYIVHSPAPSTTIYWKSGGKGTVYYAAMLYYWVEKNEVAPSRGIEGVIVNLFKEGDKTDPAGSHRDVTLLSTYFADG